MLIGFLFHANGNPVREQQYYAPGKFTFEDASVRLENAVAEGDRISVHSGFGVMHDYQVVAFDSNTALLQRVI